MKITVMLTFCPEFHLVGLFKYYNWLQNSNTVYYCNDHTMSAYYVAIVYT
jgi:hypothetical protein